MNKTWSIILIVAACIVVLGGTYWYVGTQKPTEKKALAASVMAEPAKTQPTPAKEKPAVMANESAETPIPKNAAKQTGAGLMKGLTADQGSSAPLEEQKIKSFPPPLAPVITMGGGFALPTIGNKNEAESAKKDTQTSILLTANLSSDAEQSALPIEPAEEALVQAELPNVDDVASVDLQIGAESDTSTVMPIQTKTVEKISSGTAAISEEEKPTSEKATLDGSLSVSFLDYNFPRNFSSLEKGFAVSLDIMSQKEAFGWGGTLEVGKVDSSGDEIQLSLLAKASWSLGKGVVTFPLSISLGPSLFIDATLNTYGLGVKARLGAAVNYAISDSFRIFYALGIGATYKFTGSTFFRFALEPIRIGIGFSF